MMANRRTDSALSACAVSSTDESGIHQLEDSASSYKIRSHIRDRFRRGDWWIVVGIYMILGAVALVVF